MYFYYIHIKINSETPTFSHSFAVQNFFLSYLSSLKANVWCLSFLIRFSCEQILLNSFKISQQFLRQRRCADFLFFKFVWILLWRNFEIWWNRFKGVKTVVWMLWPLPRDRGFTNWKGIKDGWAYLTSTITWMKTNNCKQ